MPARSVFRCSGSLCLGPGLMTSSSGWRRELAILRIGDPEKEDTEMGPLILPREAARVASWTDEAVSGGARLVGGGRLSETTLLPAILVEPAQDAKVSQLEVFGPVTCVYAYDRLDEAIERENALPFAFPASIFSRDIGQALHAAQRLDAGAVIVNDHTAWMPFAGRRQSGYGIGGIPWSMHEMSQEKMIVLRHDS